MEFEGTLQTANFEIFPIKNGSDKERFYLVIFEEGTGLRQVLPDRAATKAGHKKAEKTKGICLPG